MAHCEGSSYFPLPKEIRNPMKRLINIQNENNECFRSCLVRYLNPVTKMPSKVKNVDREFVKQLVNKKEYTKLKNRIIFQLILLFMKIKHRTLSIL